MGRVPLPEGRHQVLGTAMAVLAAVGLGLAVALSHFAYEGGANGITVASTRAGLMALGLPLFCLASGRSLFLPWRAWFHCAGLGVLTAMMFYGHVGAVEFISVGLAVLLFFTYPPMIAVLNIVVVRERITAPTLIAVAVAFIGLALMLGVSLEVVDWRGVALALGAGTAAAWNAVWLVRRMKGYEPLVVTTHMALVAAVVLIGLCLGFGNISWPHTTAGWGGLWAVVILQATSVPLYFLALAYIGAMKSAMFTNAQPLVSISAAYLLFGEIMTPIQLLGGGLVLAGIWLMQFSGRKKS
ncbi:MAG: DMT family transporter [Rhodospirillaceae bacterium]|nr:DMT family transporter [Rhodospirillaceae bacterium]MBT4691098.1 DMT family transporter [Rhodospirillaceae bacterium]MBT5081365.1 DMT family transporter [Rhodospirillaceae bacterium]MBT5522849.1 DMT family transporter [Rhodospirillaceae bacterium]MBT5880916.1 DMT family transporter [Rhodospirillaceae bacterium]